MLGHGGDDRGALSEGKQEKDLVPQITKNFIKSLRVKVIEFILPAPFYVLVEVGYITNPKERKRLFASIYQEEIAEGIVEGVNRYLGNRKKEVGF